MGVPEQLAEHMSMAERHEYLRTKSRQEWVPLFEKYAVDLVINGHNHVYVRTDILTGDRVAGKLPIGGTAYPETEGVVYVTAGAAGRGLYAFSADQSYEGPEKDLECVPSYVVEKDGKRNETVAWSRVRYLDYSFPRVDVTPAAKGRYAELTVSGIAEAGERIDHFTVARRAGWLPGGRSSPRSYMRLRTACLASVNSSSVSTPSRRSSPSSRSRRSSAS